MKGSLIGMIQTQSDVLQGPGLMIIDTNCRATTWPQFLTLEIVWGERPCIMLPAKKQVLPTLTLQFGCSKG